MRLGKNRFLPLSSYVVGLAYVSLVFWMHIWTLETGLPHPGEPTTPHHQVCTWLGTSGDAGVASFDLPGPPKPTFSTCAVFSSFEFVPFGQLTLIQARGPPFPSV